MTTTPAQQQQAPRLGAHVVARLLAGLTVPDGIAEHVEPAWKDCVLAVLGHNGHSQDAFTAFTSGHPVGAEMAAAVFAADPRQELTVDEDVDLEPEVPALLAGARIEPEEADGASPWLDGYEAFSRQWSPNGAPGFHAAVGLWLLSVIAARRVVLHLGSPQYTPLFIALIARSSLWAKTTTADLGTATLRAAGLDWLLASDDATPAKFLHDLAGHVPENLEELPQDTQARARLRLQFSGQRGWFYEEFGQHLNAMMRADGPMADFRGLLRRLDDSKASFEYGTISRGSERIDRPYVPLLANLTPADLAPHAGTGSALWGDGFLPRIALVAAHGTPTLHRFPTGERSIPSSLTVPLLEWHAQLGVPTLNLEGSGLKRHASVTPADGNTCVLGTGVFESYYAYRDAVLTLADRSSNTDLDGNYARFPAKALRIAMLLASLENGGRIERRHWARGQQVAEGWRANLHALVGLLHTPRRPQARAEEDQVLAVVGRRPHSTANEVARFIRGMSSGDAQRLLDGMTAAGALTATSTERGAKRYALAIN